MRPVTLAFLVINIVVFGMWLWLGESQFMVDNFLVSWQALAEGRWWTLLTSEFSHLYPFHIFVNMYVLMTFGSIVEQIIGSARFLAFYLVAAVVASFGHAAVSAFVLHDPSLPALGASGALSGVILVFSLLIPRARLLLLGIIPMPAIVGAFVFVGLDVLGLIAQTEGSGLPIGHGAHLGGALVGALYYLFVLRPLQIRNLQRVDYGDVATWRRRINPDDDLGGGP